MILEHKYDSVHKEPSHLDFHCLQMCVLIYLMYEFTRLYPTEKDEFEALAWAKLHVALYQIVDVS